MTDKSTTPPQHIQVLRGLIEANQAEKHPTIRQHIGHARKLAANTESMRSVWRYLNQYSVPALMFVNYVRQAYEMGLDESQRATRDAEKSLLDDIGKKLKLLRASINKATRENVLPADRATLLEFDTFAEPVWFCMGKTKTDGGFQLVNFMECIEAAELLLKLRGQYGAPRMVDRVKQGGKPVDQRVFVRVLSDLLHKNHGQRLAGTVANVTNAIYNLRGRSKWTASDVEKETANKRNASRKAATTPDTGQKKSP